jgi:hypothetical protein
MRIHLLRNTCIGLLITSITLSAGADSVIFAPDTFIADAFDGNPPDPQLLWINTDQRHELRKSLDQDLRALRIRYWAKDNRSVWILDEIGKDKPITTGVIVKDGRIERLQVLIFRESRGWEVKHPFFSDQFIGVGAAQNNQLDRRIDGITGATLSVQALERQARLALFLAGHIPAAAETAQ